MHKLGEDPKKALDLATQSLSSAVLTEKESIFLLSVLEAYLRKIKARSL